ncbi:unnamed protein product [Prorocentrum cordatum]|uniref:Uncharacterized protein n=1 Tax=Prorocentrum cordatum TaxID=2364126 RepID=A0ABN9Y917_9DINO|nr:unnamed protein product [Polarella glacialis]
MLRHMYDPVRREASGRTPPARLAKLRMIQGSEDKDKGGKDRGSSKGSIKDKDGGGKDKGSESGSDDKGSKDKGSEGNKDKGSIKEKDGGKDKGSEGSKDKGGKDKGREGSKDKGSKRQREDSDGEIVELVELTVMEWRSRGSVGRAASSATTYQRVTLFEGNRGEDAVVVDERKLSGANNGNRIGVALNINGQQKVSVSYAAVASIKQEKLQDWFIGIAKRFVAGSIGDVDELRTERKAFVAAAAAGGKGESADMKRRPAAAKESSGAANKRPAAANGGAGAAAKKPAAAGAAEDGEDDADKVPPPQMGSLYSKALAVEMRMPLAQARDETLAEEMQAEEAAAAAREKMSAGAALGSAGLAAVDLAESPGEVTAATSCRSEMAGFAALAEYRATKKKAWEAQQISDDQAMAEAMNAAEEAAGAGRDGNDSSDEMPLVTAADASRHGVWRTPLPGPGSQVELVDLEDSDEEMMPVMPPTGAGPAGSRSHREPSAAAGSAAPDSAPVAVAAPASGPLASLPTTPLQMPPGARRSASITPTKTAVAARTEAFCALKKAVASRPTGHGTPTMPGFIATRAGDGDAAGGDSAKGKRFSKGDAQLKDVVENGRGFKARSPLGWQFKNQIDTGAIVAQQYEEAEDKEQFKMNWAREKYKGVHALRAFEVDPMHGGIKVMHFQVTRADRFTKAWTDYTEQNKLADAPAPKKEQTQAAKDLAAARKICKSAKDAVSDTDHLMRTMDEDDEWDWAEKPRKDLEALKDRLGEENRKTKLSIMILSGLKNAKAAAEALVDKRSRALASHGAAEGGFVLPVALFIDAAKFGGQVATEGAGAARVKDGAQGQSSSFVASARRGLVVAQQLADAVEELHFARPSMADDDDEAILAARDETRRAASRRRTKHSAAEKLTAETGADAGGPGAGGAKDGGATARRKPTTPPRKDSRHSRAPRSLAPRAQSQEDMQHAKYACLHMKDNWDCGQPTNFVLRWSPTLLRAVDWIRARFHTETLANPSVQSSGVCSGMMVFRPSEFIYQGMVRYLGNKSSMPLGDQQVIAEYFDRVRQQPIQLLGTEDLDASFGQCIGKVPGPGGMPAFVHKSDWSNSCFRKDWRPDADPIGCRGHPLGPYWRDHFCRAAKAAGLSGRDVAKACPHEEQAAVAAA